MRKASITSCLIGRRPSRASSASISSAAAAKPNSRRNDTRLPDFQVFPDFQDFQDFLDFRDFPDFLDFYD